MGRALFRSIARAQITGQTTGMIKILFHTDTLEILGIHCFGYQASEIVHIVQAIMRQPGSGNRVTYFTENTFNYPTMAEAYRVAALNGLNRIQWQERRNGLCDIPTKANDATPSGATDDTESN